MSELKSCAGLANASELYARNRGCSLEFSSPSTTLDCETQEVKEKGINAVSEISAELQRERQRNAELMERISLLEAQIREKGKASLLTDGQDSCPRTTDRNVKKFKRQNIEPRNDEFGEAEIAESIEMNTQINIDTTSMAEKYASREDCLVNWISMDDTQVLHLEKFKDRELEVDCEESDDSDGENDEFNDEDETDVDDKNKDDDENLQVVGALKGYLCPECPDEQGHFSEGCHGNQTEPTIECVNHAMNGYHEKESLFPFMGFTNNNMEPKKHNGKEKRKISGYEVLSEIHTSGQEIVHKGSGVSLHKNPQKVPFCPNEVKRIIESKALLLKNAQSHTIRKIIVFASLGIRHGCEDMYELDFNRFSILKKGEPYVSATDPGEHVLYENPGVRRKVFYPNRQNQILCPVQILEEEKAMRPSDSSCPSCLFLCIKYGGRTRNLPQNEYVRQRMGRNKLKSFGPLICHMALLVHIRSGSFFFKALGITLLFMAGYSDDIVQKETKYRNLDLLQKYYRTDGDAEGEELFHLYPVTYETKACPASLQLSGKKASTKSSGKKQSTSISKPKYLSKSSNIQTSSSSVPPTQFGLLGYTSIHTQAMAAFQSVPSLSPTDMPISKSPITPNISYHTPTPYPMFPLHPPNAFMSTTYWPPSNAFHSCMYPPPYVYHPFPPRNYISLHPQPYYGHPSCNPFMPKKDATMEPVSSDSSSSSSSTETKNGGS